jgi:hypothetical protein
VGLRTGRRLAQDALTPGRPLIGMSGKRPASDDRAQVRPIGTLTEPAAEQNSVNVAHGAAANLSCIWRQNFEAAFTSKSCLARTGSGRVMTVWFVYLDDAFWVSSGERNVKVRNVLRDPRVSLALGTADAPFVAEGRLRVHRDRLR